MRTAESRHSFVEFLARRGTSLDTIDALSAVQVMIDFYVGVRAEDVDLENGGDMLLFQWGTYDWGSGPIFEYDVTRQLVREVVDEDDADDAFWQLSLALHYVPTAETHATGSGGLWCSTLDGVDEFPEVHRAECRNRDSEAFCPSACGSPLRTSRLVDRCGKVRTWRERTQPRARVSGSSRSGAQGSARTHDVSAW